MRLSYQILSLLISCLPSLLLADDVPLDSGLAGLFWSPDKDAKIQFYPKGNAICAKIVWLEHPGKDVNNPDQAQCERNLLGLEIFKDFRPSEGNTWVDGTVYDPDSGNTYRGKLWLSPEHPGRVSLRGYIGISLFGRTEYLERAAPTFTEKQR